MPSPNTEQTELEHHVLEWTYEDETGASSLTIARTAVTLKAWKPPPHPRPTPADLRRCLLLIEKIPGTAKALPILSEASPYWNALTNAWDQLSAQMRKEWGEDLSNPEGQTAPHTYQAMRNILKPLENQRRQPAR